MRLVNRETGCVRNAPAASSALADLRPSPLRPRTLGALRRRALDAAHTRPRAVQSYPTKPPVRPSARRPRPIREWAETPRHSADRGRSYADKSLQPGQIERPMLAPTLMTRTRIPSAHRGAILRRVTTRQHFVRTGSGSRTSARKANRKAQAARPIPGPAG